MNENILNKLRDIKIAHHRNGISGEGFHVCTFIDLEDKTQKVAILFDGAGQCAVFDLKLLAEGIIKFGVNSWRAEYFEPQLRKAIEKFESER